VRGITAEPSRRHSLIAVEDAVVRLTVAKIARAGSPQA